MAFTPITLQIEDILVTEFIPDAFTKVNSNFLELQGNFENLINDLQINVATGKIGETAPITSINTQNIILDSGTLVYKNASAVQVASLTLNGSEESVFTVDHIVVDSDINVLNITSTGTITAAALAVSGAAAIAGKASFAVAQAITPALGTISLVYNSGTNYSEGTINLTNSTPGNNWFKLAADSATYSGTFNAGLLGIKLTIQFDGSVPPVDGSEFTFGFAGIFTGSTDITATFAGLGSGNTITLIPEATVSIQGNAVGTLAAPIDFMNSRYKSNITFVKASFDAVKRLIIIAEKNMTTH